MTSREQIERRLAEIEEKHAWPVTREERIVLNDVTALTKALWKIVELLYEDGIWDEELARIAEIMEGK